MVVLISLLQRPLATNAKFYNIYCDLTTYIVQIVQIYNLYWDFHNGRSENSKIKLFTTIFFTVLEKYFLNGIKQSFSRAFSNPSQNLLRGFTVSFKGEFY